MTSFFKKSLTMQHPHLDTRVSPLRQRLLNATNATTCLKHQAVLSVAYGAGLRVAEVSMLKVADVDSERMLLRVERGKGGRYRNALLSEDLLTLLRHWWKVGRQQGVMYRDGWLFPGQYAMKPISTRQPSTYGPMSETQGANGPHSHMGTTRAAMRSCPIRWCRSAIVESDSTAENGVERCLPD